MLRNCFHILAVFLVMWAGETVADAAELKTADLIAGLKQAMTEAQKAAGPPYWRVKEAKAEIKYVVKQEGEGTFTMYVVTVGGTYATEIVHRIEISLEPEQKLRVEVPGGIHGVVLGADADTKRLFIGSWDDVAHNAAIPLEVGSGTRISGGGGAIRTFSDIKAGSEGVFLWTRGSTGAPMATDITILKPK